MHAAGSGHLGPWSVSDVDVLSVMTRVLDLVNDRESEVGTGDVRVPVGVEERDLTADPVGTGSLARGKRTVATSGADEEPVELLGRLLGEHHPGGLALQGLGPVLLRDLPLDNPAAGPARVASPSSASSRYSAAISPSTNRGASEAGRSELNPPTCR